MNRPWWNIKDSNLEPYGYEPCALTCCANVPLEQVTRIEPVSFAWKADVLPLDHTCVELTAGIEPATI